MLKYLFFEDLDCNCCEPQALTISNVSCVVKRSYHHNLQFHVTKDTGAGTTEII